MILLDWNNRILFETIQQRFGSNKRELLAVDFADFDGVSFKINTPEENKAIICISIAWSCMPQLLRYGAKQDLQKVYGPMFQATPEPVYDVTLKIDLDNPSENPENLPQKLSNLKRQSSLLLSNKLLKDWRRVRDQMKLLLLTTEKENLSTLNLNLMVAALLFSLLPLKMLEMLSLLKFSYKNLLMQERT